MHKLKEIWEIKKREILEKLSSVENLKQKLALGCFVILIIIFSVNEGRVNARDKKIDDLESYYKVKTKEYEKTLNDTQSNIDDVKFKYNNLSSETKDYTSLSNEEKEVVDVKIAEVKQETAENLAAEKAAAEAKAAEEKAAQEAEREKEARLEAEKKAAEEEAKKQAEAQKYNTGITRDDLARDSDGRKGSHVKFSGKIIQVINGTGYNQYRMAVGGNYDKVILLEISTYKLEKNILENDYITIEGESTGNTSYTTVMGAEMTVPSVIVDNFYY